MKIEILECDFNFQASCGCNLTTFSFTKGISIFKKNFTYDVYIGGVEFVAMNCWSSDSVRQLCDGG